MTNNITSESALAATSSSITNQAYCINAQDDHNEAFSNDGIYTQFAEQLGLQVINYKAETYQSAINHAEGRKFHIVHERRHGTSQSGTLSNAAGGSVSTSSQDRELVDKVCELVAPGGIYLVEGCLTGLGKGNLLKHFARSCQPGTRLIGAKASHLYLDPPADQDLYMSNYLRFYSKGYGVTRYYYHTQSGKIQNIPEEELFALWEILKPAQADAKLFEQAFDLCFTLLAERHDPETFQQVSRDNRALISQLIRDPERVITFFTELRSTKEWKKEEMKRVWHLMLTDLEGHCQEIKYPEGFDEEGYKHDQTFCIPYSEDSSLYMPRKEKVSDSLLEDAEGTITTISNPGHPYAKTYLFLLGCALIDRYKATFMLLDNQSAGNNPAIRAIHALSDLSAHGAGNQHHTICAMLASDIQLIKTSYRIAKQQGMLSEWYVALSKGVCFDNYIERARAFYHDRLSAYEVPRLETLQNKMIDLAQQGDIKGVLDVAQTIETSHDRSTVLKRVVEELVATKKPDFVLKAAQLAQTLSDNPWYSRVLEKVMTILITTKEPELILEANTLAQTLSNDLERSRVLEKVMTALVTTKEPDLILEAKKLAQAISTPYWRSRAFMHIVAALIATKEPNLILEAKEFAQTMRNGPMRTTTLANVMIALITTKEPDLILIAKELVQTLPDGPMRAMALEKVIIALIRTKQPDLILIAKELVQTLSDGPMRTTTLANVMIALITTKESDLVLIALDLVQMIPDEYDRAMALVKVVIALIKTKQPGLIVTAEYLVQTIALEITSWHAIAIGDIITSLINTEDREMIITAKEFIPLIADEESRLATLKWVINTLIETKEPDLVLIAKELAQTIPDDTERLKLITDIRETLLDAHKIEEFI